MNEDIKRSIKQRRKKRRGEVIFFWITLTTLTLLFYLFHTWITTPFLPIPIRYYNPEYEKLLEKHKYNEVIEKYEQDSLPQNANAMNKASKYIYLGAAYSSGKLGIARELTLCAGVDKTAKLACEAEILRGEGRYREALTMLSKTIEVLDPYTYKHLEQVYLVRGKLNYDLKQYANALRDFELSLSYEPINKDAQKHKSMALDRLGRADEAKIAEAIAEEMDYL